jgi:antitoxin VapB
MRAKLFKNGNSQALRLPKEFRFEGTEVEINRIDGKVIITPLGDRWIEFLASDASIWDNFPDDIEDLPPQERDFT